MKWEYETELFDAWKSFGMMWGKTETQKLTDRLNELAEDDWELVAASETSSRRKIVLILKRVGRRRSKPYHRTVEGDRELDAVGYVRFVAVFAVLFCMSCGSPVNNGNVLFTYVVPFLPIVGVYRRSLVPRHPSGMVEVKYFKGDFPAVAGRFDPEVIPPSIERVTHPCAESVVIWGNLLEIVTVAAVNRAVKRYFVEGFALSIRCPVPIGPALSCAWS